MDRGRPKGSGVLNEDEILVYVKEFIERNSYSPSLRQIVANTSFKSTSSASSAIQRLVERGLIKRVGIIARGMTVTSDGWDYNP